MDKQRRKELQAQYKQMKVYMGIVKITNTQNGKIFIDSYPDLRNQWPTIQMWLTSGIFSSSRLVKEWKEYGPEAFEYEVLEEIERGDESPQEIRQKLSRLEKQWMEKLQPYGDAGYNNPPRW